MDLTNEIKKLFEYLYKQESILIEPSIIELNYDKLNELVYIKVSNNKIERTMESKDELFIFDFDINDKLVGIEILSISKVKALL